MPDDAANPRDEPLLEGQDAPLGDAWQLPASAAALKPLLLARTAAVVRGRRRRRMVIRSLAACALYSAGIATAWALLPRGNAEQDHRPVEMAQTGAKPADRTGAVQDESQTTLAVEELNDPWQLRQQVAKASPTERIRLLRRAGDLYLLNSGDVESALNCYRQMLELTPRPIQASVDPNDTWLLAELKLARHHSLVTAGTNQ
jgi:hypothetical protein